ncbi:MAG: antibiotic biosynthesis monooxygenase family protein [Acidimicrobiales bacterium]
MVSGPQPAAPRFAEDQVVTVFRSRRRPQAEPAYQSLSREMESKARSMPGFVDFKSFTAVDGEQVSVVTFATPADQRAWRDDLSHGAAQQRGRDEIYDEYSIQVARCTYVSDWSRPPERPRPIPGPPA